MEELRFVGQRAIRLAMTVLLIAIIIFLLMRVIPGDPALSIAGMTATESDLARIRHGLGTDRPIMEQFAVWMGQLFSFQFGNSLISGQPVIQLIADRFPLTLELSLFSMGFALLTGIPLGILSAMRKGTLWDWLGMTLSQLGLALPGFWLGILLLLAFAVAIPIFPLFGPGNLINLVLPAIALGAGFSAILTRHVRNSLVEELSKEYVVAARAKGLSEGQVLLRHALRNALTPVLTIAGIQFGHILGGAVIIEQVFSLPGLGRLILTAVTQRDFPLVQGSVVFIAVIYSMVNFVVDILHLSIDPRAGAT